MNKIIDHGMFNDVEYVAIETTLGFSTKCNACAFGALLSCGAFPCLPEVREDKRNVFWLTSREAAVRRLKGTL